MDNLPHASHDHVNPVNLNKAFITGIVLNLLFVVIEFGAGLRFDSLALISDAGHNLSDVVSLVIAMLAFRLMKRKPSMKFTYGYKKSTVLASLLNAGLLLVAVGMILAESIKKLSHPEVVDGHMIAWVAGIGIIINAFTARLFMKDRKKDLNVKGAYLHMAADALVSAGVLIAGIVMQYTGWYIVDPLISVVIAIVILCSTTGLLFSSLRLSLDGVPAGIEPTRIRESILRADRRITDVHHMHIWAISTSENALTAHIVVVSAEGMEELKGKIKELLKEHEIDHATLEFEIEGACRCADTEETLPAK